MTVPAELARDDAAEPCRADDDIKIFVAAIAVALRESVAGFEEAVSRVTEITAMRPGRADRELVVALQDFDRLQQEFATLGDVLGRISSSAPDAGAQRSGGTGHPLLDGISMAGLKARLSFHLRSLTPEPVYSEGSDEVEF
ncbi:MAG TPA: hypothetical protein VG986_16395 [Pseudolabrys sp.]|nr:hypothetical protein [Pseudolabrys sp.]